MRKNIVAGNWKMNADANAASELISNLKKSDFSESTEVIIAPSYTNLALANELISGSSIELSSQNMHESDQGAFTGEVSAEMLKSVGVTYVILGHSERRAIYKESSDLLKSKVDQALKNDLKPIFCVGEELKDRKDENHFKVVENQLSESLFHLSADQMKNIVIAYEPVWAIGTGETASPEQAQEMHAHIRKFLSNQFSSEIAEGTSILYGGSVKPGNAKDIFANKDVDGGLIGGAALKAEDFTAIINSFE
ncbi:MAG: triose-phosphate isomerase [Psychroflexus halocasei]